jgi:poly-gamma-glutamate synthesis protein (capsule biosynthesis protein)
VFYGLGNLLHQGMQDMGRFDLCRDYGLLARVHLAADADGHMRPRAVEAIPLTDMHLATRPMPASEARVRVEALNHLAAGLDDHAASATGVRFTPGADGRGLYCLAGAASLPGRIGALCRDWQPASSPAPHIARRVAAACGGGVLIARGRERGRLGAQSRRRESEPVWSLFQGQ